MRGGVIALSLLACGCASVSEVPVTDRSTTREKVTVTSRTSPADSQISTAARASAGNTRSTKSGPRSTGKAETPGPGGTSKSKPVARSTHVVRPGDTLFSIAWGEGLDFRELAKWNGIPSPYIIKPGQQIKLAPAQRTTVKNSAPSAAKPAKTSAKSNAKLSSQSPAGWIWPVEGPILSRYSANSGNKGIDIGGSSGQGIRAAAAGRVVYAGSGLRGYGQLIIVKHDEAYLSAYAHNSKLLVEDGKAVKKGQQIALMGNTGTDRVKLHFEIRHRGKPVDPLKFLPKRP